MTVPADEVERRVQLLSRGIRDAGLRLTHRRSEILRVAKGVYVSVAEVERLAAMTDEEHAAATAR